MSNDVKSRMKGFITEARSLNKVAKAQEDEAKLVSEKLKQLEEAVIIGQTHQKNIDLEYDKVQNDYYAAVSKKELLQRKITTAEAEKRAQTIKIESFGSKAEECNKQAAEAEEKYNKQIERMAELRRGLKDAHALSVLADKEVALKQMEIKAAQVEQHESLQRLAEAEHQLENFLGDTEKYDKIADIWEAKCETLEVELLETKANAKLLKGQNCDSLDVTEELREESMFLQMNLRRFENRAEYAEGIVDKLEQQCERLNDALFLENGKFMEMSQQLEQGAPQKSNNVQDRLQAPSSMELPMSPANAPELRTPEYTMQQDDFIAEESTIMDTENNIPVEEVVTDVVVEEEEEFETEVATVQEEEQEEQVQMEEPEVPAEFSAENVEETIEEPVAECAPYKVESDIEQTAPMLVEGDTSEAVE